MTQKNSDEATSLSKIVSFCKRRGFVFPSSEIYGGFAAVYDYGHYGVALANAVKREWWRAMVQLQDNIVGLDSGIFMSPRIWEASGHVKGFADPVAECKECNGRIRVDHLLATIGVIADEKMDVAEINALFQENKAKIVCPTCGKNNFTEVKKFNLLVKSNLGNFTGDVNKDPVYLRGETCQGIYVNYKNVLAANRVKIPFGIAQIGKAFRNEITARQFIFRTREFEQMEMQYFTHPDQEMVEYEKLRQARWEYYRTIGISSSNLQWHKHEKLVFYAKEAYDIEYRFPFGFSELEGIHARGDYDLTQHTTHSGTDLSYIDQRTTERYTPHIIESSVGVGRTFLAILCEAYHEEEIEGETRTVLKFTPKMAPVKVAVFPLVRNRPELVQVARKIYEDLRERHICEFDDSGNIGKRYRRQDEIGTPYCITVDYDTLSEKQVTIRNRDDMRQERVSLDQLGAYIDAKLKA
ncbi:MAG: glycine--tRNA ligase [Patescibacteria group bacterium]